MPSGTGSSGDAGQNGSFGSVTTVYVPSGFLSEFFTLMCRSECFLTIVYAASEVAVGGMTVL